MTKMLQILFANDFEKRSRIRSIVLILVVLILMTAAVYMQVGNHEFLNFDDDSYVTNNPHVSSGITGNNIIWAFTTVDYYYWQPITWLSHMVDAQFYGMNPRGHHLTNVVIHILSSVLLLFFLLRVTRSLWESSFIAFLFALHPLHVESVAWVAERKDVLSAFFWFLTLLCYSEYVAKRKPMLYFLSLFSFLLGLMSKPMLVTLPIVLLLMDFWPLDRYRHVEQEQGRRQHLSRLIILIKEKIPFFACSLLSGVVTIYGQHKVEAMPSLNVLTYQIRIENALVAYVKYICKTFWPNDLAVFYPFPLSIPFWQIISSLLVLLLLSAAAIRAARRCPYFAVGWFWFLVTLLPVIGLTQAGSQSMADRFSYIPVIGLFIIAAWGVSDLAKGLQHRQCILSSFSGVIIIISAALTWQQVGYWRDNISLYRHTLQVTIVNGLIHCNLGFAFESKGDLDAAIQEYHEALRIIPNYANAHYILGHALASKGNLDAAIQEYQESLRINPRETKAHNNLGIAFANKGDKDAAILEFREALRINPIFTDAHYNLGDVLVQKGDLDAAILEFQEVIRINPDDVDANNKLGSALAQKRMQNEIKR